MFSILGRAITSTVFDQSASFGCSFLKLPKARHLVYAYSLFLFMRNKFCEAEPDYPGKLMDAVLQNP